MDMEDQEDMQDLSSQDADDDFERRMIQNARDERRLQEARHSSGRVQAFRKARTQPRVGLTLDNLERNNARNHAGAATNAHVKFQSPPSSSGSARSDPAIHAPAAWGRKSRSNRNWMRTITYDEQAQTPPPADDTVHRLDHDQMDDRHVRQSIEDSPLSHKSTPRHDRSAEWDLTFELNEASIIASTPYIPRNTVLDDIRQREAESAKTETMPESPSESTRRPRLPAPVDHTSTAESTAQESTSPGKRLRTRTNSWQSIGKSRPVTGTGKENSAVAVYKTSTETVSVWEQEAVAGTRPRPSRPLRHRREDSQDLLRRLARASNTPSPGRIEASRPQIAPASQLSSSSNPTAAESRSASTHAEQHTYKEDPAPETPTEPVTAAQQEEEQEAKDTSKDPEAPPVAIPETETEDADVTPMPTERRPLEAKTPVVTGAWVDTPGPRTIRKHISIARSPSQSPKKSSPQKIKSPQKSKAPAKEVIEAPVPEAVRPQLPKSALQALVQEAKAHGRRESADFGDSTINSLEDLISSPPEGEPEEDTLLGLQLPTITPRTDAERQRHQELLHLHRMNDSLRAARTSIRDASRGMKRVEDRVEHSEDMTLDGDKFIVSSCPCAQSGHNASLLQRSRHIFWNPGLKTRRAGTCWRTLGGLTSLSILLVVLVAWWISEEIACEMYCHHPYANFSPHSFSVDEHAPRFPFVLPTMLGRQVFGWMPGAGAYDGGGGGGGGAFQHGAPSTAEAWHAVAEEIVWDQSMAGDEVIR